MKISKMTSPLRIWLAETKPVKSPSFTLATGIVILILGVLTIIWSPYHLMLNERLRMRPGLPPYDWWAEPPKDVSLGIYIYNITNAERFLNGDDPKLLMEEIGPINFKEVWKHQNVVFNENGTMSYLANKTVIYNEEDNHIDLNATIVVPNLSALLAISYFWDLSTFAKFGLNSLLNLLRTKPLVKLTIRDFLWNNSDPFLGMAHTFLPSIVPIENMGIVPMLYRDFSDNVTAFVGTESGHELYSLIDKYSGSFNIPGHGDSCKFKIANSSEGIIYNQMITPQTVLRYYRKPLCRVIPLYYENEYIIDGLTTYKFIMSKDEFNRIYPPEDDCFDSQPSLPNGFTDVSKCIFSFPITVGFVYFNFSDDTLKTCAEIQRPKGKTVPLPYLYVEPVTGIPLISSAAVQVNMNVRPLRGFDKMFDKFSDKIVPLFWLHFHNKGVPSKVMFLIRFFLALPIIGWVLTVVFFIVGVYCIWKSVKRKPLKQCEKMLVVRESFKALNIELQPFLEDTDTL